MRRATGLEGSIVDNAAQEIRSFDPLDDRVFTIRVAGPGGLLVAKLHKIGERNERRSARLRDKDAHDLYRLMVAINTEVLSEAISRLLDDELSAAVTERALVYLAGLFAAGPDSVGSLMAGRAEEGVGEPAIVAASVAALADDLLSAVAAKPN